MSVAKSLLKLRYHGAVKLKTVRFFHGSILNGRSFSEFLKLSHQGQTSLGVPGTFLNHRQEPFSPTTVSFTPQTAHSYHQHALQSQRSRPGACKFGVIHMAMTEEDWDRIVNPSRLTEGEYMIHMAHVDAVQNGNELYEDPLTGLTVMTRLAHTTRGQCCGRVCRHCPYGHELVPEQRRTKIFNSAFYI